MEQIDGLKKLDVRGEYENSTLKLFSLTVPNIVRNLLLDRSAGHNWWNRGVTANYNYKGKLFCDILLALLLSWWLTIAILN